MMIVRFYQILMLKTDLTSTLVYMLYEVKLVLLVLFQNMFKKLTFLKTLIPFNFIMLEYSYERYIQIN